MKRRIERVMGIRTMEPGSGIKGYAEVCEHTVHKINDVIKTEIFIDLTGLNSGGTADDIIGKADTANCWIARILAGKNGTIFAGRITCLETPATGDDDINVYAADEATGVEDAAISALTETQLIDGGDFTAAKFGGFTALPTDGQYLYLTGGAGDSNATYTAGKILIELWGK